MAPLILNLGTRSTEWLTALPPERATVSSEQEARCAPGQVWWIFRKGQSIALPEIKPITILTELSLIL
jgi:hypothetical protein